MYKKARCTCKVVVLLIKPIVFLTFSLPSASWDLKVPIILIIIVVVFVVVVAVDTCGHMRDRVCNALPRVLDHPPFHHT